MCVCVLKNFRALWMICPPSSLVILVPDGPRDTFGLLPFPAAHIHKSALISQCVCVSVYECVCYPCSPTNCWAGMLHPCVILSTLPSSPTRRVLPILPCCDITNDCGIFISIINLIYVATVPAAAFIVRIINAPLQPPLPYPTLLNLANPLTVIPLLK